MWNGSNIESRPICQGELRATIRDLKQRSIQLTYNAPYHTRNTIIRWVTLISQKIHYVLCKHDNENTCIFFLIWYPELPRPYRILKVPHQKSIIDREYVVRKRS